MEGCKMKNHQIVAMSLWFALCAAAQVKTEVPAVISGAKPAAMERIKVHGAALEGNLEKDAVDRDCDGARGPGPAEPASGIERPQRIVGVGDDDDRTVRVPRRTDDLVRADAHVHGPHRCPGIEVGHHHRLPGRLGADHERTG